MNYNNHGYNRKLVGDLYHWEIDQSGYFVIKENLEERDFHTLNINEIMENIQG